MVDLEFTHTTRCPTCGRDVAAGTEHRCSPLAELEQSLETVAEVMGRYGVEFDHLEIHHNVLGPYPHRARWAVS